MVNFNLTDEQKRALENIKEFIDSNNQVFILKGYAGTGKTTLVKTIVEFIKERNLDAVLLATTGRAAKILKEKTSHNTYTIHKYIYTYENTELDDVKKNIKHRFRLSENDDPDTTIYIVDESSMISDSEYNSNIIFGKSGLLTDIFNFIGDRKIIFTGDPAQLPPVNNIFSAALNADYIKEKFTRYVVEFELTNVMRYKNNPGLAANSSYLRIAISAGNITKNLRIVASKYHPTFQVFNNLEEMIDKYVEIIHRKSVDSTIFITNSNNQTNYLNSLVRQKLFTTNKTVNKGESLIVIQNNEKYNLANGDIIRADTDVENAENLIVKRVVKDKTGNIKNTDVLNFYFSDINILANRGNGLERLDVKLLLDSLQLSSRNLNHVQEFMLYYNFIKENNFDKQKIAENILTDEYLNALRVKYGYAITCHQSQGGEWEDVFLQLEKNMFYMPKEQLYRWVYTAISRSTKNIYLLDNYCIW